MFKPLDPLLHAELRLAIMSLLISADEAEFPYIKEQTGEDLQGQTSLHHLSCHR